MDIVDVVSESPPRLRVRINITKNSKGYTHETTVEAEWNNVIGTNGDPYAMDVPAALEIDGVPGVPFLGAGRPMAARAVLADLLSIADGVARGEIKAREAAERMGAS